MGLGRLANYSDDLAEALVQNEVLPQLVYSLAEQNRYYKKAAAFCLRAVAKHSPPLAQASHYQLLLLANQKQTNLNVLLLSAPGRQTHSSAPKHFCVTFICITHSKFQDASTI